MDALLVILAIIGGVILVIGGLVLAGWLVISGLRDLGL